MIINMRDPDQRRRFLLVHLRGRLRLEIAGMKGKGRTAYAQAKELFELKGNRQSVLDQLNDLIEKEKQQ